MANYDCVIRTNYFHVKDENAFLGLMNRAYNENELEPIEIWREKGEKGETVFAFGSYGAIWGLRDPVNEDDTYGEFIDGLQKCVDDEDAILIFESGNEKLRYVIGAVEIITSKQYERTDIESVAKDMAAKMLGCPHWATRCDY